MGTPMRGAARVALSQQVAALQTLELDGERLKALMTPLPPPSPRFQRGGCVRPREPCR